MCSVLEAEKESEVSPLICEKSPAGDWVVNVSKLAKVVVGEGFTFVDAVAADSRRRRRLESCPPSTLALDKTVIFATNSDMCERAPTLKKKKAVAGGVLAWLARGGSKPRSFPLGIAHNTSLSEIREWIHGKDCVVCYQRIGGQRYGLERAAVPCDCGTVQCLGCAIDMISLRGDEESGECTHCSREIKRIAFFVQLIHSISEAFERGDELGEVSEEHLDFIENMIGVDLSLPRERAMNQLASLLTDNESLFSRRGKKSDDVLYAEMCQYVKRKRKKKKKVVTASADISRPVVVRSRVGCANCGKQFWDKSDWRRAPKCTKCQRTAYCSTKCRKKHAKAHAAKCSAKGPKKKRKVKRKPKKGKSAP